MTSTALRTSTGVVAGGSLLAAQVTERLAVRSLGVRRISLHADDADLPGLLDGLESLVLADLGDGLDIDGTGGSELDLPAARRLLAAASIAGVRSLVVLSSAMVYGAWPDNPVPLTEDAPVRPEPSLPYAHARAELERLAAEYRNADPDRSVAVLRPAVIVHSGAREWLRRSPWARVGLPPDDIMPARQFVHLDDVVDAIVFASERALDGAYNVAPDGWVSGETFAAIVGGAVLPARVRQPIWSLRRAVLGPAVAPGIEPYTTHSWVVASDRLRAEGWVPKVSSEEALVDADPARGWRALSPRARQELSLGAVGALVVVGAVAGFIALRRARRRAR
jgi:nucleoside-diphosphate-sugar epimerase